MKQLTIPPRSRPVWHRQPAVQCAALFCFSFLLYANTLTHGFVLDDIHVIVTNKYVQMGIKGLPGIWTRPTWYAGIQYRPVPATVFAMEKELFGSNPAAFHVTNVLLYATICAALFLLLRMMLGAAHSRLPFIASLFFAAHPLHTEVVANVKSLDELLCFASLIGTLFFTIRFLRDDRDPRRLGTIIGLTVCFAVGLLSKETALSFVAVVPMAGWFFCNVPRARIMKATAVLFLVAGIFCALYIFGVHALQGYQADSPLNNSLVAAHSIAQRMATAIMIIGRYVALLIFPHPLVHDYGYNQIPIIGFFDIAAMIATLVCFGLLLFAAVTLRKWNIVGFCILFFFITLAPASNLIKLIGATMGERLVFMPSLAFCLIAALAVDKTVRRLGWNARILATIIIAILVLYSWMTVARNADWRDNLTLFSRDIVHSPNSASLNASLGNMLIITAQNSSDANERAQMLLQAKQVLERAIAIYPAYFYALGNLALAYEFLGDEDSALIAFKRSIALNANDGVALVNVGDVYFQKKEYDSALVYYEKLVALDADNADARFRLANALTMTGRYDAAIGNFQEVMKGNPQYPRIKEFLGYAEEMKKRKEGPAADTAVPRKK
jgi:tetratricopeptide (TPR) repeat protein